MSQAERKRLYIALGIIAAVGLVLRLLYGFALIEWKGTPGDGVWYHAMANQLADGHGYVDPLLFPKGIVQSTAYHPPLYPVLLSLFSFIGLDSTDAHRVVGCVLGALTVVPVGLLAARLAGYRAAIIAGVLTATFPAFIQNDTVLMSEPLYALLVSTGMLLAVRQLDQPRNINVVGLGIVFGLATLARPEALLFAVLLLLMTLALLQRGQRLSFLLISSVCFALVISPWVIRNYSAFDQLVFPTSSGGGTLIGANCDSTYRGELAGSWSFDCITPYSGHENEIVTSETDRKNAFRYIEDHLDEQPRIMAIRVLRTFGFYNTQSENNIGRFFEGRDTDISWIALFYFYFVLLFGLYGVTRVRKDRRLLLLFVPIVVVVVISALVYGLTRFRVSADISLIVFASLALSALSLRWSKLQERPLDQVETTS